MVIVSLVHKSNVTQNTREAVYQKNIWERRQNVWEMIWHQVLMRRGINTSTYSAFPGNLEVWSPQKKKVKSSHMRITCCLCFFSFQKKKVLKITRESHVLKRKRFAQDNDHPWIEDKRDETRLKVEGFSLCWQCIYSSPDPFTSTMQTMIILDNGWFLSPVR